MLKKLTSILVVVCMIASLCGMAAFAETATVDMDEASVYSAEDSITTSGESSADYNNTDNSIINSAESSEIGDLSDGMYTGDARGRSADAMSGAANSGLAAPGNNTRAFDGTNTDGTLNTANGISTTLVENSSKYNGMATVPLPASNEPPSKYSNTRVALSPDIADTKYAEAAELLGALGIMVGDAENGNFRPDDNILRSEMAKVAVYSIGLEDVVVSSQGATKFPDVPADHWATGAINVADQQGMVIGDDVGTFRPDDSVLFQEAVAIIVRALGYEPAAEDRGGYPSGYMYIASTNQLFKGIDATATAPAKRGDIAQLVFNALTVNLMEQTGYGSNVSYEVVDKTLLYDKLNVEKAYGQIVGTSETTLTGGNTTADDRIMIDKNTYLEGDTNAKQLLGRNVLFYARIDKTSDDKTLLVVREQTNKNKTLTINAADIVKITGEDATTKTVEYWENKATDKKTKTATIQADPTYIYNGKFKDIVPMEDLKPVSGNLVLLDTDMNSSYDIVFVNHFSNLVVDTISNITGRVTDKYNNGSLVFDPDDETIKYSIVKDGAEITVGDLVEWNVISYTISDDKELIKAYVSDASITGTVTEMSEDGYRIGDSDKLYEKAASYPHDINLRDKGTFYLDYENKIAAVSTKTGSGQTSTTNYAYLVGAAMGDKFETTAQFKMFTKAGETVILDSSSKMRLNETFGQEPSAVVAALTSGGKVTPQLIVYETNSSGNVTAIETAVDNTSTGAPNTDKFTLNKVGTDLIYKSASGKLGGFTIDSDTIIFDIPAEAGDDTDRYSIRNRSTLSNDSAYDALIFDLQEDYTANVVVITSSTGVSSPESPILVVSQIAETQNEDFDYTDRLYGYQGGEAVDMLAADKTVLRKNDGANPLKAGDVIQYKVNSRGEIDGITLLFDSANKSTEFMTEVTNDLTTVYGRVTKKFGGSVNLEVNGTVYNYATADTTVYLYDSTKTRDNISVVSPADIEIYEEGNEARLFIKIYQDKVQEMVIVR